MLTRATTGIDDSSYSGLYSLVSDYFGPQLRGKVYGLLQISQPLGYMLGMILALTLGDTLGWRSIYYITGSLGVVLALVIFFSIKEAPRGKSEPELAGMDQIGVYRFDWKIFRGLLKKRSLQLIFIQGFFGVFPWNVITYWFFRYLETERNYSDDQIMITMVGAILALSVGYYLGGALGDYAFKRNLSGRLIVGASGTLIGALLLWATMNIPLGNFTLFSVCMVLTSLFMPFASPNIISTVYDISLPEVRSTAMAVESFIEEGGAALAPLLAGLIAVNTSLSTAIQVICITAWLVCVFFFVFAARAVPADIRSLRQQLEERARHEKLLQSGG
jgi:MFS family permease